MHHTLADRERGNFCRMFAEVTAAPARLTPENAVAEIDRLILTAWRRKLPVYLDLPSDISYLEIEVPELRIHDSLERDAPTIRPAWSKPRQSARVLSYPRIGALHHRYDWQKAA